MFPLARTTWEQGQPSELRASSVKGNILGPVGMPDSMLRDWWG